MCRLLCNNSTEHVACCVHSGQWFCGLCTKEDDLRLDGSSDVQARDAEDTTPHGVKRKALIGLTDRERKVCTELLLLQQNRNSRGVAIIIYLLVASIEMLLWHY